MVSFISERRGPDRDKVVDDAAQKKEAQPTPRLFSIT